MSRLLVDISALERVRAGLGTVVGTLCQLGATLDGVSSADIGTDNLDRAAGDFMDKWSYGTKKLGEAADMIAQELDQALEVYSRADSAMANVFRSAS